MLTRIRWTVGLALLADTIPQNRLAQAMGYVSLGMTLGLLIAPLLGGIVFDRGGYNAVFAMCYGLIGLDIILRLLLVEKKIAAQWDPKAAGRVRADDASHPDLVDHDRPISSPEQIDLDTSQIPDIDPEKATSGPLTSSPPPTESPQTPQATPQHQRLRDRLPPLLSLLYSRRMLSALFGSIIQAALLTAFDGTLTIHVSRTFNWTSTGAALLFLPIVIPNFLAPLAGWLCDRIGGRYPASLGFLLAALPLVCLRFIDENTMKDKVLVCVLLALIGLTLMFTFPPLMAEISGVAEAKEKGLIAAGKKGFGKGGAYAQAYALFNVAFAAGSMVGPLAAGALVEQKGWGSMSWVLGLLSGITSVPTFLWLGGWVFGKHE